jgi:nucleotide-binding universal stress UspA family protein
LSESSALLKISYSPRKLQSTSVKQVTISPVQQYQKILIAHDGSEMSDKALRHALYLSKASGAELVIMNVIEAEVIPPSFVLALMKPGVPLEKAKDELRNTMEGAVKQMLEERVRVSKEAGVAKVSHLIRIGKPVEEIIAASEEGNYDLIVMASGKITFPVRSLGSIARRIIDSTRKPILIVHE